MSDFDDLRRMREAKKNSGTLARQKKLEEERRQAEAAQRIEDRKRSDFNRYNDTVVEVLEALRDATYPGCQVQRIWWPESGWGIGVIQEDWETGEHFYPRINIELGFDKDGKAYRFCIHRGQRYHSGFKSVTCGLSREELSRTLRKLHPPRVIRTIRAC